MEGEIFNNINENPYQNLLKKKKKNVLITKKGNNYRKMLYLLFLIILILSINIIERDYYNTTIKKGDFLIEGIINNSYYPEFEKIKENFIKYPELEPYLSQIKILNHVYSTNIDLVKQNKTNVHVCMAMNSDNYIFPILVSITSALENCNLNKTFLTYHILCGPDITNLTILILRSLINNYPFNFEIIFYDMGKNFIQLYHKRISQACYYRILSPIIFNVDTIIYLDGDTLVLNDLNEMYQYSTGNNYILGFLEYSSYNEMDKIGIYTDKYINSGVILLNLQKMRKDDKIFEIVKAVKDKKYLGKQDQSLLNYVFYQRIDILPSKFVIFNFFEEGDAEIYLNSIRVNLDIEEFIEAIKNPTIVHLVLCSPKAWLSRTKTKTDLTVCQKRNECRCERDHNLWYYYASKTYFLDEIKRLYHMKYKKI